MFITFLKSTTLATCLIATLAIVFPAEARQQTDATSMDKTHAETLRQILPIWPKRSQSETPLRFAQSEELKRQKELLELQRQWIQQERRRLEQQRANQRAREQSLQQRELQQRQRQGRAAQNRQSYQRQQYRSQQYRRVRNRPQQYRRQQFQNQGFVRQ